MTPLRQRYLEELRLRNKPPRTIETYVVRVAQFAKHFGCSPERLGPQHLRVYQQHLIARQVSWSMFNQSVCALSFHYQVTLGRPQTIRHLPFARRPFGGPAQVLKYLARYTHRVAISNARLVNVEAGRVTFRLKDYAAGGRRTTMTLDAEDGRRVRRRRRRRDVGDGDRGIVAAELSAVRQHAFRPPGTGGAGGHRRCAGGRHVVAMGPARGAEVEVTPWRWRPRCAPGTRRLVRTQARSRTCPPRTGVSWRSTSDRS